MICSKFANEQGWTYFKNCILVRHYSCRHLENKICHSTARRLARCFLPAFLCAHIFIKRETSGYEADNRQFREYLAPRFGSPNVRKWGIRGFGIRNTALGIRNPTNDWNPESQFHWQRLESSTCNPESTAQGIQNPRPSWIWKCPFSHIVYRSLSLIAAFTGELKLFWDIYIKNNKIK